MASFETNYDIIKPIPKDYCVKLKVFSSSNARHELYNILLWPGLAYIILAACLQSRKNKWKNKFYGKPGIPVPVNIIEQQADRGIFISVFALIGMRLQEVMFQGPTFSFAINAPTLIKIPAKLFDGCLNGVIFYPIIAPLTTPHPITYFIGTLYTWYTLFFVMVTHEIPCHEYTSWKIWLFHFVSIAPLCVAYLYLALKYPWRFYRSARGRKRNYKSYHKKKHEYQFFHVKKLFTKPPKVRKKASILPMKFSLRKTLNDILCNKEPSFSYSLCFLAGITFTLAFIWMATLNILETNATAMKRFQAAFENLRQVLFGPEVHGGIQWANSIINITVQLGFVEEKHQDIYTNSLIATIRYILDYINTYVQFTYLEYSTYMTIIFSFIATANALLLSIRNHKRHLLQFYRGKVHSELWKYKEQYSPGSILPKSLKYMGYQFGFTIWAFVIQVFVMNLLALPLSVVLMLLLFQHQWNLIWGPVKTAILTVFWVSVIVGVQKLIAQLFFLQKNAQDRYVLAIDNRRAFFNMQYFMIFANAAVGFVACLKRLFYALLFGVWNLPRLDTSTLNRFWERFDNGFMSYVGLLNLQNSLTNPCMVVFASILRKLIEQRKDSESKIGKRKLMAKNRWFLAITLLDNPWLRVKRYAYLKSVKGRQVLMHEMTDCFLKQAIKNSQLVVLPVNPVSASNSVDTLEEEIQVERRETLATTADPAELYASCSSEDEIDETSGEDVKRKSFFRKLIKKI